MRNDSEYLQNGEEEIVLAISGETPKSQMPDEQSKSLKTAPEVALEDSNPTKSHLEQLNKQVDEKKQKIVELELKRYDLACPTCSKAI